jgi:hypothetical protein
VPAVELGSKRTKEAYGSPTPRAESDGPVARNRVPERCAHGNPTAAKDTLARLARSRNGVAKIFRSESRLVGQTRRPL